MKFALADDVGAELCQIIEEKNLRAVFQPIIDYRARSFLGYEALIRGPAGSKLEWPEQLFGEARERGYGHELEHACRAVSIRAFACQKLTGKLFLNASPGAILDARMRGDTLIQSLSEVGLSPSRVVFELTENEQINDLPGIHEAMAEFRRLGFQIAIDDLGEGFANLRMWSELRPEFVKVDKHFIQGIATDKIKYHFVRAMQDLAEICHAALIAEGIETEEDFLCARDMGIACGQGYFIARPTEIPPWGPSAAILETLSRQLVPRVPGSDVTGKMPTVSLLLRPTDPVQDDVSNEDVIARFNQDPDLELLPVVSGQRPVGLISRYAVYDCFSKPFQKEIFWKKTCARLMDASPVVVEARATVQDVALILSQRSKRGLKDGFLIAENGKYLGIGHSQDLISAITEMQLSAARYANPLTQLPGNVPINEFIDRMLVAHLNFVVAYIDIDHFKPFNDTFGYRRGDDVIRLLAEQILESVDKRNDFVGHIGGDDFLVVFQSEDWEARCWKILTSFANAVTSQVSLDSDCVGGYLAENRRGETVRHAFPVLSIGAVRIDWQHYESHREVAAAASEAKKFAKRESKRMGKEGQGAVFVERRQGCSVSASNGNGENGNSPRSQSPYFH